ncbi:MAG TPA: hypothetical protein VGM54_16485 [Chthoniobacter sp.]|jgi:hypothetical protein
MKKTRIDQSTKPSKSSVLNFLLARWMPAAARAMISFGIGEKKRPTMTNKMTSPLIVCTGLKG